nr:hypothetical protein [Tanacetum cinerariifolium]
PKQKSIFELMDIPEDSQVKYVAYKLRGAASSWWDNLQKGAGNCRQYSRTVSEYAEEFKRLASRNQVASLESSTDNQKTGSGSSMYKTKTDTSSQSGGDAKVDHSKSTHEVDGEKKTITTTTSTHAINKSSINPYARLVEGDKAHSESEDEGLIISPNAVFEDDDHSEAFLGLVRRLVLTSTKKIEDSQLHNIFQTRENIISRDIVTRLKLTPKKHPKPYKIGWIKAVGEVRVTEQCEVLFAIGKYKDTVLSDIVDMDCHVLLGRPWQSDLNVVHKEKENTYTFSKGGRKFTLYSLFTISELRQYSRTVSEYAKEFIKLASRNQLSESDAQQVARFNNGLRYDIQAIASLHTTWTIDEAVRIALKAGSSMYKTKTDTNQSTSSRQSGGDAKVDHSKSTHEVDGEKKTTITTTTSTHAINKSSINPYARPVGNKCFKCQEVGHTSNQCRATKLVNLAEGDKAHSESEDEGLIISPNAVFEDGDDHSEAFLGLVRRLLTPKKHPKPYKIGWIKAVGEVRVTEQCDVLYAMGKYKDTVLFDMVDMDCHVLLGRPWQSDLTVVHKGKENTYTFSKGGRRFTLCPYSDEVQATTTKEKKNRIMFYSTRNKDKNICVTTISPDKVLNPIRNSWSSSFQEGENDGGPKKGKRMILEGIIWKEIKIWRTRKSK